MDVVIPIVFPDYLITIKTRRRKVKVPDLLPRVDIFPDVILIPSTKYRIPELGHAGVLFLNGKTGVTKYYEYGRYDVAELGLTRRVPIPNVKIGSEKHPTRLSLIQVLNSISVKAGHGGRIEAAYVEVPHGSFDNMLAFAVKQVAKNRNPKRQPYDTLTNSCMHFVKSVIQEAGAEIPWIADPRPNSFIEEVQSGHPKLSFRLPNVLTADGVEGF